MNEKTQDITVGENSYQIRRLSAQDGSWVLSQFSLHRWYTSEEAFASCQKKLLLVVSKLSDAGGVKVPMPVMAADGRIAIPDLVDDLKVITALTMASFAFSVGPTLTESALQESRQILSGLKLPNTTL